MKYDLTSIGIYTDQQYECIYTTISSKKEKNAGAFAFIYLGDDRVMCRIFEGSKTLKNIQETRKYVVNVTRDPMVFTTSTIDRLADEYYTDDEDIAILKDVPSYMVIDVDEIEMKTTKDFPIKGDANIYFIYGTIKEFVVNDASVRPFNRGFSALIESLVNAGRYRIVDDEKRQYYMGRLEENKRIVDKVSDENTKKAMELIVKEYEKN